MSVTQRGLERRVAIEARRISSQHRQLDELYALLTRALAQGDAEGSRRGFQRFRDALEAHFAMEDEVHFPALHGLRPELETSLMELVADHRGFVGELDRVAAELEADELEAAAARLTSMANRLAAHEDREEAMLADLRP